VIAFIRDHKDQRVTGPDGLVGLRWGVEPVCAVLAEHGINISTASYYEWVDKQPTRQQLRDVEVTEGIRSEREHPKTGRFVATLGSRKMWLRLRGRGHDVARCTVERLMRDNGWEGAATAASTAPRSRTRRTCGSLTWWTATSARPHPIVCGSRTSSAMRRSRTEWGWETFTAGATQRPGCSWGSLIRETPVRVGSRPRQRRGGSALPDDPGSVSETERRT